MGYYSTFKITPSIPEELIAEFEAIDADINDALLSELNEITEYDPEWYFGEYMHIYGKWYNADADMVEFSQRFPTVTFDFEQVGEDGEGKKYWIKNGVKVRKFTRGWVETT